MQWDYYGPFGFASVLADADEEKLDPAKKVDPALLLKKEVALFGTPAEVTAQIMRIKESCGYEDFAFNAWFEKGGFQSKEIEDQMQYFAEEVSPCWRALRWPGAESGARSGLREFPLTG